MKTVTSAVLLCYYVVSVSQGKRLSGQLWQIVKHYNWSDMAGWTPHRLGTRHLALVILKQAQICAHLDAKL